MKSPSLQLYRQLKNTGFKVSKISKKIKLKVQQPAVQRREEMRRGEEEE